MSDSSVDRAITLYEWKNLPAKWKLSTIDSHARVRRGASPRPAGDPRYFGGNIPWIKIGDATSSPGKYLYKTVEHLNEEGKKRSVFIPKESLIVANSGVSLGFAVITKIEGCVHDGWLILDEFDGVDKVYLYYVINFLTKKFRAFASGTTQPNLNTGILKRLQIPLPPVSKQEKIVNILESLDYKIELNRAINQTIEHIAQAIFKSWFVEFEPVKAKIEAKQNGQDPERAAMCAISGKTDAELDALLGASTPEKRQQFAAAALFPDELEESILGLIPKGWKVNRLGDIVIELRRGISPKYLEDGGVQVVNQKCIRNHTVDFSLSRRNDPEKRKVVGRELQVGDVLVNSTGVGTLGRLAPVRYLPETTVVDSHVTVVRADKNHIEPWFLSEYLQSKEVLIENSGAGSTGQTELRKQILEELTACNPGLQLQKAFSDIIDPLYMLFATNEREQATLTLVREGLLPKLISGELETTSDGEGA